jgi:hypothetical protein
MRRGWGRRGVPGDCTTAENSPCYCANDPVLSKRARDSSNEIGSPAIALAASVGGLASQTSLGPERPGKFRLKALTVT